MNIDTFDLTYKTSRVDGGAFLAGVEQKLAEVYCHLRETFRIWEGTANNIITSRNNTAPDQKAYWSLVNWSERFDGLMVGVPLGKTEGFDVIDPYYELAKFQAKHVRLNGLYTRECEPEPDDFPEIHRRAWTFRAGATRLILCAFSHYDSDICKLVETGTKPVYEMICTGSPL